MAVAIKVPTRGESVSEATVAKWFKKVGDAVEADEPLVELETDKVTVEVPSPSAGVLTEILVRDGGEVEVGATSTSPPSRTRISVRPPAERSEEHTSELQSLMPNSYAVFCFEKIHKNIVQ